MIDLIAIVAAIRHRKIAACLIVAEIAVAFAILSNALSLIGAEVERVTISSGTAESNLLDVFVNPTPGSSSVNSEAAMRQDVRALAGIAGVKAVSVVNQVPYGGGISIGGIDLKSDQHRLGLAVAMYLGDASAIATLGVRLVAGRGFRADEMVPYSRDITPPVAILTRAAARRLFGGSTAVGRIIYHAMGRGKMTQVRVIGIVDKLVWPNLLPGDTGEEEYSIVFPEWPSYAPQAHYMLENFPLVAVGVLLGTVLAFATSTYLLVHGYSLSRLPVPYVIVGAAILLGLNQLAVFAPARRAAAIAPAEAARL
ncbi:MAG: ABC transporter permease [Steroidobacteraceae bacterium]